MVGFEPTPLRTGALILRLRPLGHIAKLPASRTGMIILIF